jgi:hypothetical protein
MTKQTKTKPKCNKGTPCGYSCISGKLKCSDKVLKRDADALLASVQAKPKAEAEVFKRAVTGHNYTVFSSTDIRNSVAEEVLPETRLKQIHDITKLTGLDEKSVSEGIDAIMAFSTSKS